MLWSAPAKRVRCSREPLEAIPHSGPMPDAQCLERGVLPQRALQLLEAMLRQGLMPDGITYDALVSACETGVLQQRALELLEVMLHQGLLPDGIIYNALSVPARRVRCSREPLNSWRQCCTKAYTSR